MGEIEAKANKINGNRKITNNCESKLYLIIQTNINIDFEYTQVLQSI